MKGDESEDPYEHFCLDCGAVIDPQAKNCATCGADITEFIETDDDSDEETAEHSLFIKNLHDERILFESDSQFFVLTTHRIRLETSAWGISQITSIMLEEISSCANTRTSKPLLLVLATLFFLAGAYASFNAIEPGPALIGAIVITAIFVIIYVLTRRQILEIASAGATMRLRIEGMSIDEVKELIDRIEIVKNERYLLGRKNRLTKFAE
jgi:hypothetical protein